MPSPSLRHGRRMCVRGRRIAAVAALVCAAPAGAAAAAPPPPDVPAKIAVDAGHRPFLVTHAVGVQSYPCDGAAWGASTPRAVLLRHGRLFGRHFGGPTWEARDGSAVVGTRIDGVTVDPTAIPWLLLSATSTGAPHGTLARTSFIQRVNTTGGLAPAAAACTPERAGERVEVPYTADYVFYTPKGRG